jgi:hypothetical protein
MSSLFDNYSSSNLRPESIHTASKILDAERYNGRVNVIEPENPDARFQMFEKISVKNKATEYREAIEGVWEQSDLSRLFFSAENMQIIQNGIKAGVYKRSGNKYVLPNQNSDSLRIIMRSIYLQYAKHQKTNITGQIEELNDLVWDYAIPYCFNEATSYMKYLQDQSSLVVPLAREMRHDRNYKQLQLPNWF